MKELMDTDGENRAVRAFLLGREVGCKDYEQMRRHMTNSGFDNCWPAEFASIGGHMSKAGQQMWLRHLFALEHFDAGGWEPVATVVDSLRGYNVLGYSCDEINALAPGTKLFANQSPAQDVKPVGYLVGHSGEYHYFRHKADAEREKAEQERLSGEVCGDVEPLFRRSAIFF